MHPFHRKMIEREAKSLAKGMRAHGLLVTRQQYLEILDDLSEIAAAKLKAGKPPLAWISQNDTKAVASGQVLVKFWSPSLKA